MGICIFIDSRIIRVSSSSTASPTSTTIFQRLPTSSAFTSATLPSSRRWRAALASGGDADDAPVDPAGPAVGKDPPCPGTADFRYLDGQTWGQVGDHRPGRVRSAPGAEPLGWDRVARDPLAR